MPFYPDPRRRKRNFSPSVPSSSAPPFLPTDLAGLQYWSDITTMTGLSNGDPIPAFIDLSGNGRDATASVGQQALYRPSGVGGVAGAEFDGVDDIYTVDLGANLTTFTAIWVGNKIAHRRYNAYIVGEPNPGALTLEDAAASGALDTWSWLGVINIATTAATAFPVSSNKMISMTYDGVTTSRVQSNAVQLSSGNTGGVGLLPKITRLGGSTGGFFTVQGCKGAVMIYNRVLSDAELEQLFTLYAQPRFSLA